MQRVILLGEMGQLFGETWEMNVDYMKDIFKLIQCQRPGFKEYLLKCHENGTDFTMKRGKEFVGEEELLLSVGSEDIIITPIPAGAKSGIGKILLAIAIVVVTWGIGAAIAAPTMTITNAMGYIGFSTAIQAAGIYGTIGMTLATTLALQGLSQMLMPGPEVDKETPDNYLFNGSSEHIKEGLPVPLCYGEMMVGGGLINQTMTTRRIVSQGMRRSHGRDGSGDFNNTVDAGAGGSL